MSTAEKLHQDVERQIALLYDLTPHSNCHQKAAFLTERLSEDGYEPNFVTGSALYSLDFIEDRLDLAREMGGKMNYTAPPGMPTYSLDIEAMRSDGQEYRGEEEHSWVETEGYVIDYLNTIPAGNEEIVGFPAVAPKGELILRDKSELAPEEVGDDVENMIDRETALYISEVDLKTIVENIDLEEIVGGVNASSRE